MLEAQITKHSNNQHHLNAFLQCCQNIVSSEDFKKWFSNLKLVSLDQHQITLEANSKFIRDWLNREFFSKNTFLKSLQQSYLQLKKITAVYLVKPETNTNEISANDKIINLSLHNNVFAYGTDLNNKFTFDNFIATKYNKIALSMAKIVSKIQDAPDFLNDKIPLFIHGGVGLGKTHLAQAIAWQLKNHNTKQKVVYLSAEKFMFHFVQSVRNNDTMAFKEKMRSIDVLIVDDVQFISGKDGTQQEFMNCFNALVSENKQVVLICDRCPSGLDNIDEKLKSRISGGMIVQLQQPDFSDRLAIIQHKIQKFDLQLNIEVLNFIAHNIKQSVRDLEGALKKIVSEKLFGNNDLSMLHIKNLLASYITNSNPAEISCQKIQQLVADYYQVKQQDLVSTSKLKHFVKPRQIAMYLCKQYTNLSLQKISHDFAKKNHATVLHAIKTIELLQISCQKTKNEILFLQSKI
jgi:chromosomal replication initiator protein